MTTIYVASKTRHAEMWRSWRTRGVPIISTWIDEAGPGESADLSDLWLRCIKESSSADVTLVYREPEDILKGGFIELGSALASGRQVIAIGLREFTIAHHPHLIHFEDVEFAIGWIIGRKDFSRPTNNPDYRWEYVGDATPRHR